MLQDDLEFYDWANKAAAWARIPLHRMNEG